MKCPISVPWRIISLKIGIVSVISSELIIPTDRLGCHSSFSQTDKIGNVGSIANFVILYIFSFILYLQHIMLVNVKLDVSRYKRIIFQGHRLHWSSSFLMAQLKWSWQYQHSCILWRVCEKPEKTRFQHPDALRHFCTWSKKRLWEHLVKCVVIIERSCVRRCDLSLCITFTLVIAALHEWRVRFAKHVERSK